MWHRSNFWLCVNIFSIFLFSNTISVNFWFEPTNSSKDHDVKNSEESNDTSIETDKDEILKDKTPEGDKTKQEDLQESNNSEQAKENKDDTEESEIKSDANKERKHGESEREKEEKEQEEEETEIELSATKYLAVLREAEILLYRATRSHEKVKYLFF